MSYAKFTRKRLIEEFGFSFYQDLLFPKEIPLVTPSVGLLELLEDARLIPLQNEKAQTEFIITPILREVWRNSGRRFAIHSGESFDVDVKAGFAGECDFIFTADPRNLEITAPIVSLVEAKKDNFDAGVTQGAAQLYASRLFNERKGISTPYLWGCTANGWGWQFFQLRNEKEIIVHPTLLAETNLPELLGAWKLVIDQSLAMVNVQ
jgi:hypothetical protein